MPSKTSSFFVHVHTAMPMVLRIFYLLILWRNVSGEGSTVLDTKNGQLKGRILNVMDRKVREFLAVPYAKEPRGKLRFAPTELADPWTGVKDATAYGYDCYSIRDDAFPHFSGSEMWNGAMNFSENCLHVNIWAPDDARNATVLVWIFGGGFFSGSPSLDLYNGSIMAAYSRVVVVNINYRLGPFGFLYGGAGSSAPGNIGLADQQLALKWVQMNIEAFGGDPGKVTLFGESAGAASVSTHLLAPDSWPLFRYAIMQSGGINAPWGTKTVEESLNATQQLLKIIGCTEGTMEDRLACARNTPATSINNAATAMSNDASFLQFCFVPVVEDKHFFKGHALKLLESGRFKNTSLIIGVNTDEGTFWLPYYLSDYFNNTNDGLINKVQYWDSVNRTYRTELASKPLRMAVAFHYTLTKDEKDGRGGAFYRDALAKSVGDYFFTCKTLDLADVLADYGANVYVYHFQQRSSVNEWPKWMGVMHGYEIEYVFGIPLRNKSYRQPEVGFSKRVLQYWTNFAKDGTPHADDGVEKERDSPAVHHLHRQHKLLHNNYNQHRQHRSTKGYDWPSYNDNREYLKLDSTGRQLEKRPRNGDCAFWRETQNGCGQNKNSNDDTSKSGGSRSGIGNIVVSNLSPRKFWQIAMVFCFNALLYTFMATCLTGQ